MSDQIQTSENWVEHSMHSSISTGHSVRAVLVGLTCLVLGLYGIYDHQWAIPAEERAFERGEVSRNVLASLDAIEAGEDIQLIPATIETLNGLISKSSTTGSTDQDTIDWGKTLVIYRDGIDPPSDVSPTDWPSLRQAAKSQTDKMLGVYGDAVKPGWYDRDVQWLFIASLPFAPYYFWSFVSTRGRRYQLDPDGTLHLPEGTWKSDEIADIDMHRWMVKSVCWVVKSDSTRIKLDAHIYKNLDKIIGVVAHRLKADEWSLDARPVTADKNTASTSAEEE
tara:strand:+ start:20300 stop:21139 length:840 start_codon:yes stop_codon:yes gene_type:complete